MTTMNFSFGVEGTTDGVILEEVSENMDMGDMGMHGHGHQHETHFRGMDAPGDDSGTNFFNYQSVGHS